VEKIVENLIYVTFPKDVSGFNIYKIEDSILDTEEGRRNGVKCTALQAEKAMFNNATVLAFYSSCTS
jgi:hypothetical protein